MQRPKASQGTTTGAVPSAASQRERSAAAYEPPAYRIVSLDCEITAYAPDEEPLF